MAAPSLKANVYQSPGGGDWLEHEAARLRTMDDLQAMHTEEQLAAAFAYTRQTCGDAMPTMLDIGAAGSTVAEEACRRLGGEYYALDINEALLSGRATDAPHRILSDAADIRIGTGDDSYHIPDRVFMITNSRAVIGWNAPRAEGLVAEQLRVTANGGVAAFGEFDWRNASAAPGSDCVAELREARNIILSGLRHVGFDPNFGDILGNAIQAAVSAGSRRCTVVATPYEFPIADYRNLFLQAADTVLAGMGKLNTPAAGTLRRAMNAIAAAEHIAICLPSLVTYTVYVHR